MNQWCGIVFLPTVRRNCSACHHFFQAPTAHGYGHLGNGSIWRTGTKGEEGGKEGRVAVKEFSKEATKREGAQESG